MYIAHFFHAFVSSAFQHGDMDVVPSPEPLLIETPFTVHLHLWGLRHMATYEWFESPHPGYFEVRERIHGWSSTYTYSSTGKKYKTFETKLVLCRALILDVEPAVYENDVEKACHVDETAKP